MSFFHITLISLPAQTTFSRSHSVPFIRPITLLPAVLLLGLYPTKPAACMPFCVGKGGQCSIRESFRGIASDPLSPSDPTPPPSSTAPPPLGVYPATW